MKDVSGQPMLARVVNRVLRAKVPTKVLIATSTQTADDAIAQFCDTHSVLAFRGNELDVLDRYYQAAREHVADVIVRITGDCPLIEPELVDHVVNAFLLAKPDYASNTIVRTYPRGLDVEVVSMPSLECAWHEASEGYQRTHVTPYFYQNPMLFRCLNVADELDRSSYRWTVDTVEDLEFVRAVYGRLGPTDTFGWREVLDLLEREPALAGMNRGVPQKTLQEG
jgi:spore coat polysaccharide biosynthesis protein SpsF (cytidylyltransferase family)